MGDATARGDGITRLLDRLEKIDAQIRDLQRFDGTQNSNAISKIRELVSSSVSVSTVSERESGFAVTGTLADHAVASLAVPEGFTRAVVSIVALVGLFNTGAAGSWATMRLQSRIQTVGAGPVLSGVAGGMYGTLTYAQSAVLADLAPGSVITAATQVSFPGSSSNASAVTSMTVIFLR